MLGLAAVVGLAQIASADPTHFDLATAGLTAQLFDQDARRPASMRARGSDGMGPAAKTAIPALAQVLRDPDIYVAVDASQTLDKMGSDAAIAVIPLLKDCNPRVRELAAQTLGNIGPERKSCRSRGSPKHCMMATALSVRRPSLLCKRWASTLNRQYRTWRN